MPIATLIVSGLYDMLRLQFSFDQQVSEVAVVFCPHMPAHLHVRREAVAADRAAVGAPIAAHRAAGYACVVDARVREVRVCGSRKHMQLMSRKDVWQQGR